MLKINRCFIYILRVHISQGEDVSVGLVARILGWNRDGVPVLELYDTVPNLLLCFYFHVDFLGR